jgi:hypothetical protein
MQYDINIREEENVSMPKVMGVSLSLKVRQLIEQ